MKIGLLAFTTVLIAAGVSTGEESQCCFTNPGYSGVCAVTPAKDETCKSILDYLNNPTSGGKSYCGGTDIRGGWQQTSCKPEAPSQGAGPRAETDKGVRTAKRPSEPGR